MCRARGRQSLGSTPNLDSSPDVFTWTITPSLPAPTLARSSRKSPTAVLSLFASFTVSTVSTTARDGTPVTRALTLLLWRCPMKCHTVSGGICGAFSTISCT